MSRKGAYGLFAVFAAAFLLHFVLERQGVHIPFVHAYMDDLLCMPLVLFPLLLCFRLWGGPSYVFPAAYPVAAWVMFSFFFEVWIPYRDARFTSDPADMLCYALGGLVFWQMQRPFSRPGP